MSIDIAGHSYARPAGGRPGHCIMKQFVFVLLDERERFARKGVGEVLLLRDGRRSSQDLGPARARQVGVRATEEPKERVEAALSEVPPAEY
jgi:hypothetical protein